MPQSAASNLYAEKYLEFLKDIIEENVWKGFAFENQRKGQFIFIYFVEQGKMCF